MSIGALILLVVFTVVLHESLHFIDGAWSFTPPGMEVTWGMRMTATVLGVAVGLAAGYGIMWVLP